MSHSRLIVFAFGVGIAWLAWEEGLLSAWWLAVPLASFAALLWVHDRTLGALRRAERAALMYEQGIARLEDRWAGRGDAGTRFLDELHPYARDMDLFGEGSLFELLCTTRTPWGAQTLADWLRAPASPTEIRDRQSAVAEIKDALDLREDIAALDEDISSSIDPEHLIRWGESPPVLTSKTVRVLVFVLAVATTMAIIGWVTGVVGRLPALFLVTFELALAMRYRSKVEQVIESVERPGRELGLLSQILALLESQNFESPCLLRIQESFVSGGVKASDRIARLRRLTELLDMRLNKMFAPIAMILLWGTQFAFFLESWRTQWGHSVRRWLTALGELEALLALAGHSFEHPMDPFPDLVEEGPFFEGEDLGHPLISESSLVRNDLRLGNDLRLFVVSGSNMSGKSTLLRTVGTNVVLALAGAPVRARRLVLSPLSVGASIRIQDSLQEGISRFYAEIQRLRQIMDLSEEGSRPLLFLLDEILHGTNSHDRRIGAEAVVRGLIDRGAVGLITTHDLALSRVADSLAPAATNVHFVDHLENGKVLFDYRLRPGVVTKSNALDLMRSIGLEV